MHKPTLRLLGRPALQVGESRELLEPSQVAQFLVVLAYTGDWIRRDEVIAVFWPEGTDATDRRNLRRLLFRARERLGKVHGATPPAIEAEGDALRWLIPTDVDACRLFDGLLAAGGHVVPWQRNYSNLNPGAPSAVDLTTTIKGVSGSLSLGHPTARQALLDAAEAAGAEFEREARDVAHHTRSGQVPSTVTQMLP